MHITQKLKLLARHLWALPKKVAIPVVVILLGGVLYVINFTIERPVTFNYAGKTCVNKTTLFPDIHTTSDGSAYKATFEQPVVLGGATLMTRSVCLEPIVAPQPGTVNVSIAPFGTAVARQSFKVTVPQPVTVGAQVLEAPISALKPLVISLNHADTTYTYRIKGNGNEAMCVMRAQKLTCNVTDLKLAQNHAYTLELERLFHGAHVKTLFKTKVRTLAATRVVKTSIKAGAIVYSKPAHIDLVFDKNITSATIKLYKVTKDGRALVASNVSVTQKSVKLAMNKPLDRSSSYELTVENAEANDGSGITEPFRLDFKTSGGPKVTEASVGTTAVPLGATLAVRFDQALSEKQDVSKFVALSGGATFVGVQGNELIVSVAGVPRCGDFTIKITNDLQSKYDIAGHSAWSYSGRTVCHTVKTIGYSSQGRPISAYYFGNGATTVLYTGTIHGNELSTKYLMDRWIQDLEEKARDIPKHVSVVIVPIINPDGVAAGSRTNANNVDLNRNFATADWRKDITTVDNQPFAGGGGTSAMSEPETKAIASLAQQLRPKVILSYHSIGGVVAANQAGASNALAVTYARLSGYGNVTGQSGATFEYTISGTADDWYAEKIGVASILVELGSHTYSQFERNQAAMWAMINS